MRSTLLLALALSFGCVNDVVIFEGGGGSGAGAQGGAAQGAGGVGPVTGGGPLGGFGGMAQGGQGGTGGQGGEPMGGFPPGDCDNLVTPPAAYDTLFGFTSSEDFVFDSAGNYVAVDDNGNLVRITKQGQKTLWIPGFSSGFMAGMVALPDDSVVVCDVNNGSLKRAYPNGAVTTLIGGLAYPNGIDVGPDGYVYVAENSGAQVRRVHPDTGASTIVASGLTGPNGVAFTDDPTLFYVGSFEGQLIYKIVQPVPGQPGTATVFANFQGGGGIDGMGVDECGNVYAAEYTSGNVYRMTPDGTVTLLTHLPSFWIPNIKWGRGLGGFDKNVMFIADREQSRLFGVHVGLLGATEFYDL